MARAVVGPEGFARAYVAEIDGPKCDVTLAVRGTTETPRTQEFVSGSSSTDYRYVTDFGANSSFQPPSGALALTINSDGTLPQP